MYSRPLEQFLLALLLATASLGVWHVATRPIATSPIVATVLGAADGERASKREGLLEIPSAPLPDRLRAMLERPLFVSERRPWRPPEIAKKSVKKAPRVEAPRRKPAPKPPSEVRLVGILKFSDGPARALLRTERAPDGLSLSVGDDLQGWRLRAITDDEIVLVAGKEEHVMTVSAAPLDTGGGADGDDDNDNDNDDSSVSVIRR